MRKNKIKKKIWDCILIQILYNKGNITMKGGEGMNISVFSSGSNVFVNCECIKGYAFKITHSLDKSAPLANINHQLTAVLAIVWDRSVHFSKLLDCFECLSPHKMTS